MIKFVTLQVEEIALVQIEEIKKRKPRSQVRLRGGNYERKI